MSSVASPQAISSCIIGKGEGKKKRALSFLSEKMHERETASPRKLETKSKSISLIYLLLHVYQIIIVALIFVVILSQLLLPQSIVSPL